MANKNFLNSVKFTKPKSNGFDLTHDVKLSFNMGELVPTLCMECVPGDSFKIGCQSLGRFAPLVSPVMHRYDVTMHYFFVPNRIVWPNWEKYITNTPGIGGLIPAFPTIGYDATKPQRLPNYMGLPFAKPGGTLVNVSAIPFAAYVRIWNDYYRDQNVQDELVSTLVNGDNTANTNLYQLLRRCWEKDYFTSCLPEAQKGDPVTIPLGSQNVVLNPDSAITDTPGLVRDAATHGLILNSPLETGAGGEFVASPGGLDTEAVYDPDGTLITEATGEATTIKDLRTATRLQEWKEKAMRAGTRYTELLKAFFGITAQDARLQRPEYIGGVKTPVMISEVLNTAGIDGELPQGNMAGHGAAVTTGGYSSYFVREHGYIIGVTSVMPKTGYYQGIPRHFLKVNSPFEQYWQQFAHIGDQEVQNQEIMAFETGPTETFGYQVRYGELRYMPNRVAGEFATTLETWQHARKFATMPALNDAFVACTPDKRVFAVPGDADAQMLYFHILHQIQSRRPMPKYGDPTF